MLLVVGSVAYDSVKTPAGTRERSLGGSATYFSIASSYFAPVSLLAVVGDDFLPRHVALLKAHAIDVTGLNRQPGETFHWSGAYSDEDANQRETLDTRLNVFADFRPDLAESHRGAGYLFLANIDPELQLEVLEQMKARPRLVGLDSMNFWIEGKRPHLDRIVEAVDVLFMDEGEVRSYSGEPNLLRAARRIHDAGPRTVVIKRGDHGVLVSNEGALFSAPAFTLDRIVDPTGAGDAFAGGFMGLLAATGDLSDRGVRRAAALGSVMGSFTVEDFSADRLASLTRADVVQRFEAFVRMTQLEAFQEGESIPWRV
jgi:sugar/nucleoside kinase (ribokinase family)